MFAAECMVDGKVEGAIVSYIAKTQHERLFELCWHMEQQRNSGWYSGDDIVLGHGYDNRGVRFDIGIYCNPLDFPIEMREGILYYSAGHGWRVRKKPHWFAIFSARFPHTVKAWREGWR